MDEVERERETEDECYAADVGETMTSPVVRARFCFVGTNGDRRCWPRCRSFLACGCLGIEDGVSELRLSIE